MPKGKERTVGGGPATPVSNQWMDFLNQGLSSGTFGSQPQNPGNTWQERIAGYNTYDSATRDALRQSWNNTHPGVDSGGNPGKQWNNPSGNPSGNAGVPTPSPNAGPDQTQTGMAGTINQYLNGGGVDVGNQDIIDQLSQKENPLSFLFNGQTGPGRSDAYTQALQKMFGLTGDVTNITNSVGSDKPTSPGSYMPSQFTSQGILGDRSNVSSAISDYFNRATQDNLADTRARLTATGGMSSGTPSAFAQSLTNIRGGEALAKALSDADLGYRTLDEAAYRDYNNAIVGNRGVDATNYGHDLDFALNKGKLGLTGAGQIGNILNNIMGGEFNQQQLSEQELARLQQGDLATNQLNLNSALGFGDINSRNLTNAGNMMFNNAQLQQQGQLSMFDNMMRAYMQAAGLGTPQANTVMEKPAWQKAIEVGGDFAGKVIPGAGGGSSNPNSGSDVPVSSSRMVDTPVTAPPNYFDPQSIAPTFA